MSVQVMDLSKLSRFAVTSDNVNRVLSIHRNKRLTADDKTGHILHDNIHGLTLRENGIVFRDAKDTATLTQNGNRYKLNIYRDNTNNYRVDYNSLRVIK